MNQRTRRRVDTGFKSLRDLALCAFGAWMFWLLITRAKEPSPWALGFSAVLMVAPSALAAWRVISNAVPHWDGDERRSDTLDEERLRQVIRDEMSRGGKP